MGYTHLVRRVSVTGQIKGNTYKPRALRTASDDGVSMNGFVNPTMDEIEAWLQAFRNFKGQGQFASAVVFKVPPPSGSISVKHDPLPVGAPYRFPGDQGEHHCLVVSVSNGGIRLEQADEDAVIALIDPTYPLRDVH